MFVQQVVAGLPALSERLRSFLLQRSDEVAFGDEAQRLRDAFQRFKAHAQRWQDLVVQRLEGSLTAGATTASGVPRVTELALVGDDTVENQILAARAALVMVDKSSEVFNEFRLRLQHLDRIEELEKNDPVQSLQLAQWLVDAWLEAGLLRLDWQICQTPLHTGLSKLVQAAYAEANRSLVAQGVLPEIDLRRLMRRSGQSTAAGALHGAESAAQRLSSDLAADTANGQVTHVMPYAAAPGMGSSDTMAGALPAFQALHTQVPAGLSGQYAAAIGPRSGHQEVARRLLSFISQQLPQVNWAMQTDAAGQRLSNAAGALPAQPPAWLAQLAAVAPVVDWSSLEASVAGVREQSRVLKRAAQTDNERAVIELVALMFDSILSEDRIPSSIRLWFARLQMPVLRTALAEPDFIASDEHPARKLLDRMGSCVLGFDPAVKLDALETEIKRVVQVIEQYPETGRKAFELMLKEFEAFLERAIQALPEVQKVTDVASQLEQKETLTVQYTIEMRKLLADAPVHERLRDFLFHPWTEVMAQASVIYGEKDDRASKYRSLSGDLLWAASAKPTRHERAQVIARVPSLMAHLREGLALLGYDEARIEQAIKPVSDALAAAFMSKSAAIDPKWLASLTQQLASLEDVLPRGDKVDWVLSRENLEMLTGQQADNLVVLANPETPTPKHLLAWAAALPLGSWYSLEHNGKLAVVQLAWQSPRKHLYLFVNGVRQSWLMQQGRVAQYLKAGLLRPGEAEALTTRATRQALGKLEANPERLLQTD